MFYLLSQCEAGYRLPSESRLGEVLKTFVIALPGISVSMIFLETIKKLGDNQAPILWFVYYSNVQHMPIMSLLTVRIASPVMFTLLSLEVIMHVLIQVLARKLDGPRGTVILNENQIVTRRMHRRLVISETGYLITGISRFLHVHIFFHICFTVKDLYYLDLGQILMFCCPSLFFFVIPLILTVSSPEVRSSLSQFVIFFCREMQ